MWMPEARPPDLPEPPPSDCSTGARLGDYVLGRSLGRGGMGEVFEALSITSGEPVAIKVQRPELDLSPQHGKRLLTEARLLAELSHPGIVRCHAAGELADGRVYLVMERASGEPLRAHLRTSGLPLGLACAVGQQIADAMAHAHARQVLHRDLKPENILLTPAPALPYGYRARVLDFSIGKQLAPQWQGGPHTALETGDALLGTPAYMSPEQCLCSAVSDRSDVYSLGVLLFEMMTGSLPFAADSDRSVMAMHIGEPAPSLRTLRPQAPAELDELLRALLAKRQDERPAMDEVAARLARLLESAQRLDLANSARFWRRLRLLSLSAGAASLGVLLGYAWMRMTPAAPELIVLKQDVLEPLTIVDDDVNEALRGQLGAIDPTRVRSVRIAPLRIPRSAAHSMDFAAAQQAQSKLVETELRPLLRAHPQARVVYVGMAPIPLALHLGFLVSEMTPPLAFVRPPRADWLPSGGDAHRRELKLHTEGLPTAQSEAAGDAVVRISASALIHPAETRPLVARPLAEVSIIVENPDRHALTSAQDVEAVAGAFRTTLAVLSHRLKNLERIHLFVAAPPGLAFRLGTVISPTMHVPVQTYEYFRAARVRYLPGTLLSAALDGTQRPRDPPAEEASR